MEVEVEGLELSLRSDFSGCTWAERVPAQWLYPVSTVVGGVYPKAWMAFSKARLPSRSSAVIKGGRPTPAGPKWQQHVSS